MWLDATTTSLGAISSWADKSGSGNSPVQATGANQPVNTANQINGLPALVFDGANDYLTIAALAGGNLTTSTMFFLAKRAVSGVGSAGVYLADGVDSTNRQAILSNNVAQLLWSYAGGAVNTTTVADNLVHVHCCTFAGNSSSAYYLDNTNIGTSDIGSNQLAGLTIGARYNNVQTFNGAIGEVIIYNRALSTTEISSLYKYFKNKWGLP